MTGRDVNAARDHDFRAARRAMVEELEGIGTDPRASTNEEVMAMVLAVVGALVQHGGTLSVSGGLARELATRDGTRRVRLDLHGIAVEGINFEEAVLRWLEAARTSLDRRMN